MPDAIRVGLDRFVLDVLGSEALEERVEPSDGEGDPASALNHVKVTVSHPGYATRTMDVTYTVGLTPAQSARRTAQCRRDKARAEQRRKRARARYLASLRRSFSGNGALKLGRVKVPVDSTLDWESDGDLFSVQDETGTIFVNSDGHAGKNFVAADTYKTLR